jgi:hypothetical protein
METAGSSSNCHLGDTIPPSTNNTHQDNTSYSFADRPEPPPKNQVAAVGLSGPWPTGDDGSVMVSDPTTVLQPQAAILPRAPVVLSYTMDEPYQFTYQYGSSADSLDLAQNFQFIGGQ